VKLYILQESIQWGSTVTHHTFEWHEPWWVREDYEVRRVKDYQSLSNLHNDRTEVWHPYMHMMYVEVLW
jgi:hypothetical protein